MNLDATFRPYVIAGFVLIILIALPFRIRSQATREKLDRTQEGVAMMIGLRLAGAGAVGGGDRVHDRTRGDAWASLPLPAGSRWTGVGAVRGHGGALDLDVRSLGPNLTDTVVTREAHTLVTRGPYRWVRHPFYDCMALFIAVDRAEAANWFLIVTGSWCSRCSRSARVPRNKSCWNVSGTLSRVPRRDGSFPAESHLSATPA